MYEKNPKTKYIKNIYISSYPFLFPLHLSGIREYRKGSSPSVCGKCLKDALRLCGYPDWTMRSVVEKKENKSKKEGGKQKKGQKKNKEMVVLYRIYRRK